MDPFFGVTTEPGIFRAIARKELDGYWPKVILGIFIYYIFSNIVPEFLLVFVPVGRQLVWVEALQNSVQISYLSNLYTMFLSGTFLIGIHKFIIRFFRRKETDYAYVFEGFSYYFKTLVLMIVVAVRVALWSMLFLIPGIVAFYRYSQAFFILAETPSKSVYQCIEESKYLMSNNKMNLFMLDISFIGWFLLASIPQVVSYYFNVGGNAAMVFVMDTVSFACMAPVMSYVMTAHAAFFDVLTGHLEIKQRSQISQF